MSEQELADEYARALGLDLSPAEALERHQRTTQGAPVIFIPKAQFDALMEDGNDDPPAHLRALVLQQRQGMGHRAIKTADEYDVHTGWRKWYLWTQRPGATAAVKRRTRRRERREAKAALR